MIDDDTLAAHVRAALDEVEVPVEGPERVLAARNLLGGRDPSGGPESSGAGAPHFPDRPTGRRRIPTGSRWVLGSAAALVALVIVAVAVVGRGGGASTTASKSSTFAQQPLRRSGNLSGRVGRLTTPNPGQSPTPAPAGPTPDRVVQTGSLTLTVAAGHLDATVAALGDRASGAGGQVAKSQTVEGAPGPSADLTLKVPAGSFGGLLSAVRSLGAATSVNTSAVDVTATYVDLTARLNALEATRAQFLQILAKAQSIGDILAVEAQITPLQSQIEQLQGQQQVLDDQTSFATLDAHVAVPAVRPPGAHPAPGGLAGAWDHARHAFATGIESIVSSLGGIAVFVVCVAVLAGLGRVAWAVVRRRLV
ncbi:MAG: DUF4349 domain-containing protein [Acidimicrobiales bacterium]